MPLAKLLRRTILCRARRIDSGGNHRRRHGWRRGRARAHARDAFAAGGGGVARLGVAVLQRKQPRGHGGDAAGGGAALGVGAQRGAREEGAEAARARGLHVKLRGQCGGPL
jgi:hypothetical protein